MTNFYIIDYMYWINKILNFGTSLIPNFILNKILNFLTIIISVIVILLLIFLLIAFGNIIIGLIKLTLKLVIRLATGKKLLKKELIIEEIISIIPVFGWVGIIYSIIKLVLSPIFIIYSFFTKKNIKITNKDLNKIKKIKINNESHMPFDNVEENMNNQINNPHMPNIIQKNNKEIEDISKFIERNN